MANNPQEGIHQAILQAIESERGNLYVGEVGRHIPFDIKRFYVIRDVPAGEERGQHAHKETEQVLFCLAGSCELVIDDGKEVVSTRVETPHTGVHLHKGVWHSMRNFSPDCVVLVVASAVYDEADYIRDYAEFKARSI